MAMIYDYTKQLQFSDIWLKYDLCKFKMNTDFIITTTVYK